MALKMLAIDDDQMVLYKEIYPMNKIIIRQFTLTVMGNWHGNESYSP